ncbi:MAG: hypothetical protein AAGA69_02990, partial [Pseudomonadota bacterium]
FTRFSMNVLIAQRDPTIAMQLADQVTRAGGRVSGIVLSLGQALDLMRQGRGPDLVLLDASLTVDDAEDHSEAWENTRGRICLCATGEMAPPANDTRSRWPVLQNPSAIEDIRLVLQAARHFGRPRAATVH